MTTYNYDAKVKWADTGIDLVAGQETFISSNTNSIGQPWGGAFSGPDGSPVFRWNLSEDPDQQFCKLLGRIGPTGTPFGIGSALAFRPDVSGRLYLIMNDGVNWNDNHGGFTVEVTQGATQSIPLIINDLARYGITAYQDGLSTGDPNYASRRSWTFDELAEILLGVQYTARALYEAMNPGEMLVVQDVFTADYRRVMGSMDIRRVENGYTVSPPQDKCNGSAGQACTSVGNTAVIFYGNVNVTQYTLVHELGHFFNDRSDKNGPTTISLYIRMQGASVDDSIPSPNQGKVFGILGSDWVRGKRGWGSGPSDVTDFQQNAFEVNDVGASADDRFTEIDEATADMFLNWVYSVATDGDLGFKNISWLGSGCQTAAGCPDDVAKPGDARLNWMNTQMSDIFSQHPEWYAGG